MGNVHVDDAEVGMPLFEHRDRSSLIADGTDDERAVTKRQSNDLCEDWFLQNRENAGGRPK